MARLAGKVAIISGGAQGMGAATARLFAAEGAKVVLGDILEDKGRAVAAEIGDAALFMKLDVRSEEDWQAIVAAATEKFGKLDILVNNAAVVHFGAADQMSKADAERVLGINVIGTMMGVKHAVPALKANGKGVIVNISSVDGLRGCNGLTAYTASKWAVRGITKSYAFEFGPFGIRVVSIHPGGVNTEMGNPGNEAAETVNARSFRRVPLQRIGEPEEIARATLFVASDEASYISGAEIAVDGGWTAGHYEPALPNCAPGLA
ncbi:SDR family NAD(P)-dependent oxidoreductase [Sphingomonas jatrophae]|uniref:3alpha(Or 20beta)-hydroxysteroid dehydrogenase n=1 Tax=Sphingomonas jatrophae TaxID=1166337 RepID=A0A1I6KJD7_9SPHN|nr:glucose 1-dehydrogenase [Sphingomonas jatrophae]SFR90980.1 3alpha(or 20beta)-hydroxysteroid dehydrogenase [Sphingomonas jatrophae]